MGRIAAVDLAATYGVDGPGGTVAVTAITLRPGLNVTVADLSEAVAAMPFGLGPDVIHVVPSLPLSATYRPTVSALRAAGVPKASRNSWYFDADTERYKRLTAAARAALAGSQS
jgi:putative long chain acyl-CoA synthase